MKISSLMYAGVIFIMVAVTMSGFFVATANNYSLDSDNAAELEELQALNSTYSHINSAVAGSTDSIEASNPEGAWLDKSIELVSGGFIALRDSLNIPVIMMSILSKVAEIANIPASIVNAAGILISLGVTYAVLSALLKWWL